LQQHELHTPFGILQGFPMGLSERNSVPHKVFSIEANTLAAIVLGE
jgi:hypothetical protein